MQQAAAAVIQETVSNVLLNTATTLADWSKKQTSLDEVYMIGESEANKEAGPENHSPASSENSFVILDNN